MNISWRYLIGIVLGLILGAGLFLALLYAQLGVPSGSSRWAFEIIQKKKAIAASIQGPRLLLVAGSSCLFGLQAKMIEEQTGHRTVNFGSHAGLGLDYILYLTKEVARPGDTLLLALEYEFYPDGFNPEVHDDYILSRDPDFFHQMSWLDKLDMATRVPFKRFQGHMKSVISSKAPRPYIAGASPLNDCGDETANSEALRPPPGPHMQIHVRSLANGIPSTKTAGFNALRTFIDWAKANHITVLATFPNTMYRPEYSQPNGQKAIEVITQFYASQGVPVIGTAAETMLPTEDFFDTVYHLTFEAAQRRTQRLIPELKPYLDVK